MGLRSRTNYIVIHCSATRADQDCTVEDIRRWHVEERGWLDIGYHWVIERSGLHRAGRNQEFSGAHVRGHNHESVGVCLVGGLDESRQPEDNFTPEQYIALEMLIESLRLKYPEAKVVGHNFLDPDKDCPCFDVGEWLGDIR